MPFSRKGASSELSSSVRRNKALCSPPSLKRSQHRQGTCTSLNSEQLKVRTLVTAHSTVRCTAGGKNSQQKRTQGACSHSAAVSRHCSPHSHRHSTTAVDKKSTDWQIHHNYGHKGVVELGFMKVLKSHGKSLPQYGQVGNELLCSSNFSYQTNSWIDIYCR